MNAKKTADPQKIKKLQKGARYFAADPSLDPIKVDKYNRLIELLQKPVFDIKALVENNVCPSQCDKSFPRLCEYLVGDNEKNYFLTESGKLQTCKRCWYISLFTLDKETDFRQAVLAQMLDDKESHEKLNSYEAYGYSPDIIGEILKELGWEEGMSVNAIFQNIRKLKEKANIK